jgi:hypothetical protein
MEHFTGPSVGDEDGLGGGARGRRGSCRARPGKDERRQDDEGTEPTEHRSQAITPAMEPVADKKPARIRGVERSLEVQIGSLGGFDLRPTRFFVWAGEERGAMERVLPLGAAPRNLQIPRRRREMRAGAVQVRSLGNPLMTIALAGVYAAREWRRAKN